MSGPLGSSQWMYATDAGYNIGQSLRFDGSSAYLNFTPSSSTTSTVTISAWVKRSQLGVTQYLFASGVANARGNIGFNTSDQLFFQGFNSSGANSVLTSSMLFRDVSAWYHIVIECDGVTTTANFPTNTNVYVNGSTISMTHSTASTPTGGFRINDTQVKHIGALTPTASSYFSGYMAEVHWIDGTAVDANSFGETKDGVWVPKAYTGSHGTAGWYLPFDDSSAIGDDESGNTNDWTANNLAATDIVSDTPTNSFCTLNPLAYTNGITLSEGNLTMSTTTNNRGVHGTMPIPSSGKWYWELHVDSRQTGGGIYAGFGSDASLGYDEYAQPKGIFILLYNQAIDLDGSTQSSPYNSQGNDSVSNGDIFSFALDVDNQKFYIAKNGTYRGSSDPSAGTGGLDVSTVFTNAVTELTVCLTRGGSYNETYSVNFGQDSKDVASANADSNGIGTFEYAVPTNFLALCTSNLPEPTIGPNSATTSDQHFGTLLYTGTGSTGLEVNGLSFTPDLLWIKRRDSAQNFSNAIVDSVRGNTKNLITNRTDAESTSTGTNDVQSFDSDGFTVGPSNQVSVNDSGGTFVAWCWKAGGTAASNSDGSLACNVSANTDAGFSIVTWTANSDNGTLGHGLNSAPELIIAKPLGSGTNWYVMHTPGGVVPANNVLNLDSTTAKFNPGVNHFNDTYPTDTVFSYGGYLGDDLSNDDKVAYCFHSVPGYSSVGSFVGNGSADGPFVYTGFRPAWVMTKRIDSAADWHIVDVKRETHNVMDSFLFPNGAYAETSDAAYSRDLLSTGFKIRSSTSYVNASGGTFIYLAFAEAPFKYANAR